MSCHILASSCIRVLHHVYFSQKLEMGMPETPSTPLKQLGFTKILFNEPEMPSINVHHLWSWPKPLPKMVSYFWRPFWIFAPSHKYLHLGNLNPINILKCPNNLEGIFRLLRIFSNVPLNIFQVFPKWNSISTISKHRTETNKKEKQKAERELTW